MRSVNLFIELLRAKPVSVAVAAALAQALLWWLVPVLFYAAPPHRLAEVLSIGHGFELGSAFGPPLAYWVAEAAFRIAGFAGVYLVAQLCVLTAYLAVFALGRHIVGDRQAALAMLLMTGVFAFTLPTAEFGPAVLAMPLWALALLHYWRAVGERRPRYWLALGLDLGLLLLTSYAGFVLIALLVAVTLATRPGRAQLLSVEPWIAGVIVVLVYFPHLIWLDQSDSVALAPLAAVERNLRAWVQMVGLLAAGHAGLLIVAAVAFAIPATHRAPAPEIIRAPVDRLAATFVFTFAVLPLPLSAALAMAGNGVHAYAAPPLVLLSALAVVAAAPQRIRILRQRSAVAVWAAVLLLPPLSTVTAIALLPWVYPIEFETALPADRIGRFYAENFMRRTGQPLTLVAGEPRLALLIAAAAPSRPGLLADATPELPPDVLAQQIAARGVLVVWPAGETRFPPPDIRARFPTLAAEAPQVFLRQFQGRLPPIRIGWGVIGPRAMARR